MSEAGGSEDENDDDPDEHLVDREGTKDDLTVMPDCSSVNLCHVFGAERVTNLFVKWLFPPTAFKTFSINKTDILIYKKVFIFPVVYILSPGAGENT